MFSFSYFITHSGCFIFSWFPSWSQNGHYKSQSYVLSGSHLFGGGNLTLGVFLLTAGSFPRKRLLASFWPKLGHMAIEPVTCKENGNVLMLGALGTFRAFPPFITYTFILYF